MNTSCQINTWTAAYLSHSDPRERVKRSDTCGSPKAHQSGADTNPDHAQHGYSTVQENGMDFKKKKKSKVGPKKDQSASRVQHNPVVLYRASRSSQSGGLG